MQYHDNLEKDRALELYGQFVQECQLSITNSDVCREAGKCVKYGTYGNRQVLSIDTNGPYSHVFDFS